MTSDLVPDKIIFLKHHTQLYIQLKHLLFHSTNVVLVYIISRRLTVKFAPDIFKLKQYHFYI